MLKIKQHFFRTFIFIFILVLISIFCVIYFFIKDIYLLEVRNSLKQNISFFTINLKDIEDINLIVKEIKKTSHIRVTIINNNGKVLIDSHEDKDIMDNHLLRPEIIEATNNIWGYSIRFSKTLKKDLLYVVKKISFNDDILYIRMADYIKVLEEKFLKLSIQITTIFTFFFLIALFLIYKINRKIEDEINNIIYIIQNIKEKNYTTIKSSKYIKEFFSISTLLNEISILLSNRQNEIDKYTTNLKLSNTQKDDIISAISHEIKNPLAIINGYTQTILEDNSLNNNMRKEFLLKIYKNSNKVSNIIDRLRLTIKLEDTTINSTYKKYSIKKLLNNVCEDLRIEYKNRKIILKGDDVVLKVDDTLFSIALTNLIENGLKYSKDYIEIKLSKNDIKIIDKGIGIEEKYIDNITTKFYRVQKNSWNNSLGLGLFLVKTIIKLHKFDLQIESKLNIGSIFIIKFK